ncbi:glutamate ABC transporter substrate-binding protein [Pseudomonas sp. KK4]|uniref:glutamate ABC transporter substrate-binding protein n=1 Tax=Pseudomonas sp. KK4 TaxID=1855729 RepID=UPI00097C39B2|nr:glutamate ABC transporter substrate-binding protein [Pseudomonas sp. KK4]
MRSNRFVTLSVSLLASCIFAASASAATAEQFPADSTMAKIQQRGKLVVGSSLNTLMFSSKNPMTGEVEGFEADLARMLAKKLTGSEDNIEWVSTTPENRIPLVENKRVDMVIATMTVTDERKKAIGFAGPYYLAGQDSLVRADDHSINKTADLDGKTVCVLSGTTVERNLKPLAPTAKIVTFSDASACVEGLIDKRFDAYVDDGATLVGESMRQPGKLRVVGSPFTEEPYGIAVTKEDTAWRNWINSQLSTAIDNGHWKELYGKDLESGLGAPQVPVIEQ